MSLQTWPINHAFARNTSQTDDNVYFSVQTLGICSHVGRQAQIRTPLRDLMDWNGAKVDHVIASTTRLSLGNGGRSDISYFVRKRHAHSFMKNGPSAPRDCAFRIGGSPFLAILPACIGWKDNNVGSKPETVCECRFELGIGRYRYAATGLGKVQWV